MMRVVSVCQKSEFAVERSVFKHLQKRTSAPLVDGKLFEVERSKLELDSS